MYSPLGLTFSGILISCFLIGCYAQNILLTPPRNVKLEIQGKREVFMSWDPPAHLPAESIKDQEYVILWSVDEEERENIFVSHSQNYTFRNLSAGQLLTAAVRFLSKGGKHIGPLSELKQISLPGVTNSSRRKWSQSDFSLENLTSTTVNITWKLSVGESDLVRKLQISAQPVNASASPHVVRIEKAAGNTHFDSLSPFTSYKFIVKDMNTDVVLGIIGPVRTWPAAPTITKLYGRALSHHEIEFRWDEPKTKNGILKPYEVYCHDVGGNSSVHIWSSTRLVILQHLQHNTLYKCTLKASTFPETGQNPKDCELLVESPPIRTLDFYFPTPRLISFDRNSVSMIIAEVTFKGEYFKNYEIFMQRGRADTSKPWQSIANISAEAQTYMVRGLEPNTRYSFIVCARNPKPDDSICSTPHSTFTLPKVLGPPRNVKLDILNRHDVRISWDPPLHLAGEASEDHDYAISWRLDDEEQDNIFVSHNHSYTFRNLQAGQSLVAAVRLLPAEGKHIGQLSETKRISLPAEADDRISATFTSIGNQSLNITIRNVVHAGTKPREIDIFIRKGGIDAPTQWDVMGTFDWPDHQFYLLHDLTPGTLYGIKVMRFEKYTGKLEGSISGSVYIPADEDAGASTTSSDSTTAQPPFCHVRSSQPMLCSCSCNFTYCNASPNSP